MPRVCPWAVGRNAIACVCAMRFHSLSTAKSAAVALGTVSESALDTPGATMVAARTAHKTKAFALRLSLMWSVICSPPLPPRASDCALVRSTGESLRFSMNPPHDSLLSGKGTDPDTNPMPIDEGGRTLTFWTNTGEPEEKQSGRSGRIRPLAGSNWSE